MSINLLENNDELTIPNQTESNLDSMGQAHSTHSTGSGQAGSGQAFDVKETIYKKVVRSLLLISAALTPVFFLPWTSSVLELNKQILLVVIAGVGLVLWLLDVVISGKLSWRFNPLDKGIVALAGAVALSSVFSVAKFKSVFGLAGSLSEALVTVVALTIAYLLIVNSFDDKGEKIRKFFSISLAVALVYGLLQIFGIHLFSIFQYVGVSTFDFTASRAFNTLGSINVLGMTAAVALPILYKQRILIFPHVDLSKLGALAALIVLAIINWWVLWIVAIAGMISVIVFESLAPPNHEDGFRISKFLFPMTVIVLGIFLMLVNFNLVSVKENLPVEIAPSYKLSGKVVWKVLQENFAFGYGPENFSLAFDKYGTMELRNSTFSETRFFDSSSHVLNVAVHNGLVGLAALGFALWLFGWSMFKVIKSKLVSFNSENVGVISSVLATIVAIFFYPFNLTLIFILYLLLALLVLAVWGNQRTIHNVEDKASLSLISSLGFIGGLVLALVGLYFISLNYVADIKYAKATNQASIEDALNHVVEAINWKENDDRFYRSASQLAINLLSQEINAPDDNERDNRIRNYLSTSVALAQRATEVGLNEANNWVNLGQIYQSIVQLVDGADALAEDAYLKASELRPGDPSFHNRIGTMYLVKADLLNQLVAQGGASNQQIRQQANASLIKAEDAFKEAIEMSNNFGLAIYNLGFVYERQGKLDDAIGQLETIAPFNSDQPGLAFELGLLYYRNNQKDKALQELQRAVVLSPDYSNARWYLSLIYEERKEIDQAIEQLEKILSVEANKNNEAVTTKIEQLKGGESAIPPESVIEQQPLQ